MTSPRKSKTPLLLSIAILVVLAGAAIFIPSFRGWLTDAWRILTSGNQDKIQHWVSGFGWFGPLLIILLMVAQMFLLIIPSWLLMIVAILAYGPWYGSAIIFAAIFAASTVGYGIGKFFGRDATQKLLGEKTAGKMSALVSRYGVWAIVITRINPMLSNDAISLIAGIVGMSYRSFIAATMAGITPLVALMAWLQELSGSLTSTLLWISIASAILFIGFLILDRKRR